MMTLSFAGLSSEGVRVMRDALAGVRQEPEHELSGALRMHERVRRWWQGVHTALSNGVEGSQAREVLGTQIAFCEADAIFLQLALENAADTPNPDDMDKAKAALAEARDIEAKARDWLGFVSLPSATPSEDQLAHGRTAYERGETLNFCDAIAQLKSRRAVPTG
jgi:hypothetical protein